MSTIVMNALTGFVTEYDWTFQSITPAHAGDATGLYALGGESDGHMPIASHIRTGGKQWGASLKKRIASVYFAMHGAGTGQLVVHGATSSYAYTFPVRETGQSRCLVGRGICENYLSFAFSNMDGAGFALDRIEVQSVPSKNRRP